MRKKTIKITLAVIFAFLLILFLSSLWLASFTMTGKRQSYEEAMEWQSERYDTSFYDELEKTDYTVSGCNGYVLHVQLLKNPAPSEKYIILSHGYTDNMIGSLKYVKMYQELGYNCIIYDLRGHGKNKKTPTTYGIYEGQDIAELVKDTRKRYENISSLGLHGESLGAASSITSLEYSPEVDFTVADCGFADIESVLKSGYHNAHLPTFLFDMADFGSKILYHCSLEDMRPIDSLANNTVPILFIHGAKDELIAHYNSQYMSENTKGISEVHYIEGAGHAESILVSPDLYKKYVSDFLENNNL